MAAFISHPHPREFDCRLTLHLSNREYDCVWQKLPYFYSRGKNILSGLTENFFGCPMRAELLEESHLCLIEMIENGKHTEI